MNPNLTEIVFILDESGSMSHLAQDTIGGYNAFLEEQKNKEGQANVTTVLFSNSYHVLHDRVPVQHVPQLTKTEYRPHGMTALLDAVGRTIDTIGSCLSAAPEDERPANVIFVITTDGEENCSTDYAYERVKEMIEHQQSKYSWQFIFVGAGIDAYRAASSIGIVASHTASYAATLDGIDNLYCSVTKAVNSIRACGELSNDWKEDGEITVDPSISIDSVADAVCSVKGVSL